MELYDEEHGPLWTVETRDTYETSRLLRPGFLASFAGRVEGRPIAILPERSTLLIGGDARPEMVERLSESAERGVRGCVPRCLTPALYTVDDAGRVVPYVHPGQDVLANRVRLAHVRLALAEYSAQKEELDALHEAQEVDLFVASYSATARKRDESPFPGVSGRTTWTPCCRRRTWSPCVPRRKVMSSSPCRGGRCSASRAVV